MIDITSFVAGLVGGSAGVYVILALLIKYAATDKLIEDAAEIIDKYIDKVDDSPLGKITEIKLVDLSQHIIDRINARTEKKTS